MTSRMHALDHRLPAAALAILLVCAGGTAAAADFSALRPRSTFIQAGAAENDTQAFTVGATWPTGWEHNFGWGRATLYVEGAVGRWNATTADGVNGMAWVTQIGITPVLRVRPRAFGGAWFAEIGIGANVLLPIYQSSDKHFSTRFNFGDHLAIGRSFGPDHAHEIGLRFQHFSNAGIQHPNPGENFIQLRYDRHF